MSTPKSEFVGNIGGIRAVEDAIRASKQYTESLNTMPRQHPIQGEGFGSSAFCKDYQVYPGVVIDWDKKSPLGQAWDWLFLDAPCIDLTFFYNYRRNYGKFVIPGGAEDVKKLSAKIPGFGDALARIQAGPGGTIAQKETVGDTDRGRTGPVPHPQPMVDPPSH